MAALLFSLVCLIQSSPSPCGSRAERRITCVLSYSEEVVEEADDDAAAGGAGMWTDMHCTR